MLFNRSELGHGRITIKAEHSPKTNVPTGIRNIGLDEERDALLYVPKTYSPDHPLPFILSLHGAGGSAEHGLFILQEKAEKNNIILLAPSSRSGTWDIIDEGGFGRDVLFINQALKMVFQTYAVDQKRLAIGGFSDGASYALSLGLINGETFTHIIAFSPGFYYAPTLQGKPKIFLSHGIKDDVLPIQPCSRRIVPKLQNEGYAIAYQEFNGGHTIPDNIKKEAIDWFL